MRSIITFIMPRARAASVPGGIGICQSASRLVRVLTGSTTTRFAPFLAEYLVVSRRSASLPTAQQDAGKLPAEISPTLRRCRRRRAPRPRPVSRPAAGFRPASVRNVASPVSRPFAKERSSSEESHDAPSEGCRPRLAPSPRGENLRITELKTAKQHTSKGARASHRLCFRMPRPRWAFARK